MLIFLCLRRTGDVEQKSIRFHKLAEMRQNGGLLTSHHANQLWPLAPFCVGVAAQHPEARTRCINQDAVKRSLELNPLGLSHHSTQAL
jgi:hypothetical protein